MTDTFCRTYAVYIEFDAPMNSTEQDRLACIVLEKLVDEFWGDAAAGTRLANIPMKVAAHLVDRPHDVAVNVHNREGTDA